MKECSSHSRGSKLSQWFCLAFALFAQSASFSTIAQQQPIPGTVEGVDSVFDVVTVQTVQPSNYGVTELIMAAVDGDLRRTQQLVEAGANVNETDDFGDTPLMWAVQSGDVNTVKYLISQGADIRAKSSSGSTAAIYAISRRYEDIAVQLVHGGADANGWRNNDVNFLELAAKYGMANLVEVLIRNGADLDNYGSSALSLAVKYGHYDIAFVLLDTGVNVNYKDPRSQQSILHMASGSGNADLVGQLLARGALVGQSSGHSSPLYLAATGGNAEVVDLLVDSGATVDPLFINSAVQKGFVNTAIALLRHLDVGALTNGETSYLLEISESLDNQEFSRLLMSSPEAKRVHDKAIRLAELEILAAKREHSRLLFVRQLESYCVIKTWDSRSDGTTELARLSSCPSTVFVSDDAETVFLIGKTIIQLVSIDNPADNSDIELPDLDYRVWVDQMTLHADQNPDYLPPSPQMRPIGVGRLADGSLGLLVSLGMPADDEYRYLFRFDSRKWLLEEERLCSRWGCADPIDTLAFRSSDPWTWLASRRIQDKNITLNPFNVDPSAEVADIELKNLASATLHRNFEINGVPSVITAYTSASEHTGAHHTFGIELTIDGGQPINLSGRQCLSSVVGRFILVNEFFRGRFEVTDIGTGETVISDLSAAIWLD